MGLAVGAWRFSPAPRGYVHIPTVDIGVLMVNSVVFRVVLATAHGPFLPAVYHPFVLREAG